MKLLLGCDPEAFLVDIHGALKSSVGKIGGSKHHPMPLMALGDGYAVQEDNVAIEFNIPPAEGRAQFIASIHNTLDYLSKNIGESLGYQIVNLSAASFPELELQSAAAQEFGCEPDYNAWTKLRNPKPKAADWKLRSCGGHVHIGYDKSQATPETVVKNFDFFCGVPSVLMDKGELRKELYGKAGAYREKSYGVEARMLSNFWIFDDKLIGWVWDNTKRAVDAAVAQPVLQEEDHMNVQNAINNNDKLLASYLVDKYNLDVVHV